MDKRQKIAEAALKLFVEKGFHNTSTATISKEAGVGTGTLFLYYPGKEELINSLYKESKEQMAKVLEEGFPVTGNTKEKLRHLWHKAIEWARTYNYAFRFIYMYKSSPFITTLTREEVAPSADFAISFIKQGVKNGEIVNVDIELLFAIIDNLLSATVNYITGKPDKVAKTAIEQAFSVFWDGICKTGK